MTKAYKYKFHEGIDLRDFEETLLLAFLAAEGIFGEARVRMDGSYSPDHEKRALTVDASTAVGQVVNAVFTAYVIKEFGRDAFSVHRMFGEEGKCHCARTAAVCPSGPEDVVRPSRSAQTPRRTAPAKRSGGERQRSRAH